MPTFDLAVRMHNDRDDDQEMITPYQFGQLMVDWTNPRKAAEMCGFSANLNIVLTVSDS